VLTNPDSVKGRGGGGIDNPAAQTPVAAAAALLGIPVIKTDTLDDAAIEKARSFSADLLVCFAYGVFFPPQFLRLFPLGGINAHPSLLPKYRGATPIQEAILRGDRETGVSIQYLTDELDAGDVIAAERFPLDGRETAETLGALAAEKAAALLVKAVSLIAHGAAAPVKQDGAAATYCDRIEKEAGLIDWTRPAAEIDAQIRAYTPWPLCRTEANGRGLLILEARPFEGTSAQSGDTPPPPPGTVCGASRDAGILIETGAGILAVTRLQWQAKKPLFFRDFLNGARDFTGTRLG
jgi:methionyl-tRNA formyltransferase